MENVYEIGVSHGHPAIIIRRKQSDMPFTIDRDLLRFAGAASVNAVDVYIAYEFLLPKKLSEAEEMLQRCFWKKEESKPAEKRFSMDLNINVDLTGDENPEKLTLDLLKWAYGKTDLSCEKAGDNIQFHFGSIDELEKAYWYLKDRNWRLKISDE